MFIFYVSDQQASRDFYAAVLRREPVLDVPGMTEFSLADGSSLGLMPEAGIRKLLSEAVTEPGFGDRGDRGDRGSRGDRGDRGGRGGRGDRGGGLRAEVYLVVDDPRECLQRAVAAGARLLSECTNRDWGDLAGYCLDADGYVLGFAAHIENGQ